MMPARSSRRDGFMMMATAHASCSQAVAAKKAPWYHVRLKWSPITAKWMPAAPSDSIARPQRTYCRIAELPEAELKVRCLLPLADPTEVLAAGAVVVIAATDPVHTGEAAAATGLENHS